MDASRTIRSLARTPGFALGAVAILALGIGANSAIFTVVNAVLIDRLPYPQGDRIVTVARARGGGIAEPAFAYWDQHNPPFEVLTAFHGGASINLDGGNAPELVVAVTASRAYFRLFGANPIMGRTFSAEEDAPGGPRVIVLSYGLWQREFGGDPSILGKTVSLGGSPYSVIGVLAPNFEPPQEHAQGDHASGVDVWAPLQADPNSTNEAGTLTVAGKVSADMTLAEANARMTVLAKRYLETNTAAFRRNPNIQVVPMKDQITGDARVPLLILLGAVGLLLLLSCANVANLVLARASARQREFAILAALGAGRVRIVWQMLSESLLLALAGGGLGLLLGAWGVRVLLAFAPGGLPRVQEIAAGPALDPHVATFTFLLAIASGVLFGLFPALQLSSTDLMLAMRDASSRSSAGRRQTGARRVLVAGEVAISVVLLSSALLLIRSFSALHSVKPGFDQNNLLTMETSLAGSAFSRGLDVDRLAREFTQQARNIPGVESAALASALPLFGSMDMIFDIPGRTPVNGTPFTGDVQWRFVSSQYFEVLRIPLISGRLLQEHEPGNTVVISQAMARKYWPETNPVGQSIFIGPGLGKAYQEGLAQIVGVVGDVRDRLEMNPSAIMYQAPLQIPDADLSLVNSYEPAAILIRTRPGGAPMRVAEDVKRILLKGNGLAVTRIRTMGDAALDSTARANFNTLLLTLFAAMALLLAAAGLYGVMSFTVEQRTRELGIRTALGATRRDTLSLVIRESLETAVVGIVPGILGSFAVTRVLRSQLFGVTASDPLTFFIVPLVLLGIALASAYFPGRRATRIDPAVALRHG